MARAPKKSTETKYSAVVVRVAASVPIGIDLWVSFNEAERFEPAIIPVTAGKKRPTSALTMVKIIAVREKHKLFKKFGPNDLQVNRFHVYVGNTSSIDINLLATKTISAQQTQIFICING